jgi:hypothetical protein
VTMILLHSCVCKHSVPLFSISSITYPAYPPPDASVREFLKPFDKGRKEQRKAAAFCLLYGLFAEASKFLGHITHQSSIETVAAILRSHLTVEPSTTKLFIRRM